MLLGQYQDFVAKYLNQRNPATGMFWTIADAAADYGISEAQADAYITQAQTANAVVTGAIPPQSAVDTIIQVVEAVQNDPGSVATTPGSISGLIEGLEQQGISIPSVTPEIVQQVETAMLPQPEPPPLPLPPPVPPVEGGTGTVSPAPSGDIAPAAPPVAPVNQNGAAGPVNPNIDIPIGDQWPNVLTLMVNPEAVPHPRYWEKISATSQKAIFRDPYSGVVYTITPDGMITPPVSYAGIHPIVYYNQAGKPYTNENQSFWISPDDNQWYMGDKQTGQITLLGGSPFAKSGSGIGMAILAIGGFLILKGLIK